MSEVFVTPSSVRILHRDYIVCEEKNLHDEDGDLYGRIEYLREQILLREGLFPGTRDVTLIHEILHGVDEIWDIRLKERQVDMLSKALYQLLIDNGWKICQAEEQTE